MKFSNISDYLEVFDLNQTQIDLLTIENRRFMYHSDGILILGAEDTTKSSRGILKSHAEEYGEAEEFFDQKLPPYDEFVRGWIGVGKHYPHGIIHFAPHIPSMCGSCFNVAFDFVEKATQNGFDKNSVLRGFGEVWERPVFDVLRESVLLPKNKLSRKDVKMSKLGKLLERAFENKGRKNRYSEGEWSIGFNERTWDTHFQLYYKNIPIMEGNTLDKELKITNSSEYPVEKLIPDVEKALPEYHFNIQVAITIPVDFNDYWTREVENADYIGIKEEVRFDYVSDGYGYDVAMFSVSSMADIKNIVITDEENIRYNIDDLEIGVGSNSEVEVYPSVYTPVREIQSTGRALPLNEKIREAEKIAEERQDSLGNSMIEKGKSYISRND